MSNWKLIHCQNRELIHCHECTLICVYIAPDITEETSQLLEDIIKQRVKDQVCVGETFKIIWEYINNFFSDNDPKSEEIEIKPVI